MHTLRSDPLKAVGCEGDEVTSEQISYLQSIVDECASRFKDVVINHRGLTSEDSLNGRVFFADEALGHGLIDAIAMDESEAVSLVR